MATETPEPHGKAASHLRAEPPCTAAASPSETPGPPDDPSPTGLTTTDSWAETADPGGTVASSRTVPEPDSLGG